jgi:choline dehydrogenase-like flavoprotein
LLELHAVKEIRLTRRRLLIGGAAGLSSLALGCPPNTARRHADYDVCIIGSGFAGIPLALRCVEHGLSTVVIEAGSRFAPSFQYRTSGEYDYPVASARLITLGGASGHWGGVTTRLMPEAFEVRSLHGDWVDWPIGYEDLDPYYCQAERFLGVAGYPAVPDVQPPRTCSFPHQYPDPYPGYAMEYEEHPLRFFPLPLAHRNDQPLRLVDEEIPRFVDSRQATLVDGERVVELATLDGESIDHVKMQNLSGAKSSISARIFVLAAGVVESPRLLLMSQSKWYPKGLGNNQGFVGRYFTYHPLFFAKNFEVDAAKGVPVAFNRTHDLDAMLRGQHLNACNYQVIRRSEIPQLDLYISPEVEPRAGNGVALSSDRVDPLGLPMPDLHFNHSERDKKSFTRAKAIGDQLQRQLGIRELHSYKSRIHSHPAGTCRMGFDAGTSVVDKDLKVFGLDNLYVSGGSVFPVSGTANPTDTVVALTLRLGDHLIGCIQG